MKVDLDYVIRFTHDSLKTFLEKLLITLSNQDIIPKTNYHMPGWEDSDPWHRKASRELVNLLYNAEDNVDLFKIQEQWIEVCWRADSIHPLLINQDQYTPELTMALQYVAAIVKVFKDNVEIEVTEFKPKVTG